jgi:hypothetical protein
MLASEDKKKALTSPSSVFKHPGDVVASGDLTKAEKTAILKQWELDARLLQVATEEGMSEGELLTVAGAPDLQRRERSFDVYTYLPTPADPFVSVAINSTRVRTVRVRDRS